MSMTLRLLSAAEHTYAIQRDGLPPPRGNGAAAPSSAFVGWLPNSPVGRAAGDGDLDAGLVGRIPEGVIVALRGTIAKRGGEPRHIVGDWLNDGDIPLSAKPGFPGQVHSGFHRSFFAVWQELRAEVVLKVAEADADKGSPSTIYVTGHSKGGAVAYLAAWRLKIDYPNHPIVVRTFAAPRMADAAFKAAYEATINDHIRYEFEGDLVPNVPLTNAFIQAFGVKPWVLELLSQGGNGYVSVGRLGYIKTNGAIVTDSPALQAQRDAVILNSLTNRAYARIVDSHTVVAGHGYCAGQYPP